jgi:hypothetical protein
LYNIISICWPSSIFSCGISFHQQSSTCKQKTRKFIVKLQLKTNNL